MGMERRKDGGDMCIVLLFLSVVSCCFPKLYLEKKTKQTQNNGVTGLCLRQCRSAQTNSLLSSYSPFCDGAKSPRTCRVTATFSASLRALSQQEACTVQWNPPFKAMVKRQPKRLYERGFRQSYGNMKGWFKGNWF